MSALLLALVLLAAAAYLAGAVVVTRRFAMRRRRADGGPRHGAAPPVSVLKPLHGLDAGLAQNLRSFADQQYPHFQLVFGVRERTDRALPVARALIAARPDADIELIVDATAAGSNRKVANLENMLPAARHDVLVIADSDMRVTPDYLAAVTAPLGDPRTGLVTCLYKAAPVGGLWSQLAALHINFGFLPGALVGEALGVGGGCFGATIALRREVFERIGGFARVRNELADDHRMGAAVRRLGLRTVLSTYIVENQVHEPSLASLWRHELRWARTSRTMAPAGYAGSLVSHTVAITVGISVLGATLLGSPAAWGLVPAALALRWLSAAIIAGALGLPRRGLWLLPLRDALSFAVFVGSFCGRSVRWRGQRLRVMPSGRISVERDKPV